MGRAFPYPLKSEHSVIFITDLHLGRRAYTAAQLENAGRDLDYLEQFVNGVAVGGDLIHWANAATPEDAQWTAWYNARKKSVPWVRVAGNHDLASFGQPLPTRNASEWLAAIKSTGQNQIADLGLTRMISLTPDVWARPDWETGLAFSTATLDWFESELVADSRPTWVVAHNPLSQQYPGHMEVATQERLSAILSEAPNVIGWLSGHRHADIRTDLQHAVQLAIGSRRIAGVNGPPAGGQVLNTTVDPWDSKLHAMVLTYSQGRVICRWRDLISRTWDTHQGVRSKVIEITV